MPKCKICGTWFDIDDYGDSNIDEDTRVCPECHWSGETSDDPELEGDDPFDDPYGEDEEERDPDELVIEEELEKMKDLEDDDDDDLRSVEERFEMEEGDYA